MNPSQWFELVEWVNLRWPDRPWKAEQAVAYYHDLEHQAPEDVWSALYALYGDGRPFAPTGSELLSRARQEARRSARDRAMASTPELPEPRGGGWDEYTMNRFGEKLRPQEVIERLYEERRRKQDA